MAETKTEVVPKEEPKEDQSGGNRGGGGGRGGFRGGRGMRGGGFNNRGGGEQRGRGGVRGAGRGGPSQGPNRGRGGGFNNRGGGQGDESGMRGGARGGGRGGGRGGFDRVRERLQQLQSQNMSDLEPLDYSEKKFTGRSRLYIGNLSSDCSDEALKELMSQYGEVGQIFYNAEKNFAFLRMGTRDEAEKAKRELDGKMRSGRPMKVRFAPHPAAIKVLNLGQWVSNELLHKAFSIFGEVERCLVSVDDRGRSKGEGFVEFERKPSALEAQRRCSEGCFFLTSSLRPVVVELIDETEDDDGLQEKSMHKRSDEFHYERETAPRFSEEGSFEYAYGQKWKALYDMKKQKIESLEREMKLEEDKLVAQMEYARYEHETEQLRDQLRRREANRDQQKSQWEERERKMSEMMRQEQERRTSDEASMMNRIKEQDNAMMQRQQENSLFMQAREMNMLDQGGDDGNRNWNEEKMNNNGPNFANPNNPGNFYGNGNFGGPGGSGQGPPPFQNNFDNGNGFQGGNRRGGGWGNEMGGPGNKRRRF